MDARKMEKVVTSVIEKLEKLENHELAGELRWCWGSYQADGNPSGLVKTGFLALGVLQDAREKKGKSVAKKLVEGLEDALA
jgi:hypothetical protein